MLFPFKSSRERGTQTSLLSDPCLRAKQTPQVQPLIRRTYRLQYLAAPFRQASLETSRPAFCVARSFGASSVSQDAEQKAKDAMTDAKTGAAQTADSAKGMAQKAGDRIQETASQAWDKAKEVVGAGQEQASEAADKAKDAAGQASGKAKDMAEDAKHQAKKTTS
ncbi:hypothetical protein WJX84_000022 [Apatococcus fuscideae]|uniref:Uncharacterized protein n=1 Tax=Apatococcus fuscideae TaxID=2026836 RepID=A0AAW1RMJ4_9CHLO